MTENSISTNTLAVGSSQPDDEDNPQRSSFGLSWLVGCAYVCRFGLAGQSSRKWESVARGRIAG